MADTPTLHSPRARPDDLVALLQLHGHPPQEAVAIVLRAVSGWSESKVAETVSRCPPADEVQDEFERLVLKPSRFWAILRGESPTADELRYLRGRPAVRDRLVAALRERNDPRAVLFSGSVAAEELAAANRLMLVVPREDHIIWLLNEVSSLTHEQMAALFHLDSVDDVQAAVDRCRAYLNRVSS